MSLNIGLHEYITCFWRETHFNTLQCTEKYHVFKFIKVSTIRMIISPSENPTYLWPICLTVYMLVLHSHYLSRVSQIYATVHLHVAVRVTWGMTAPGGKTAPLPVDNLKLPRTFSEYTEWCYHLTDTCFERSTPRSRRKLKYSILNIYTCFDVIFHHHYTSHNYLYIGDNK